jgi:hypothetical protein
LCQKRLRALFSPPDILRSASRAICRNGGKSIMSKQIVEPKLLLDAVRAPGSGPVVAGVRAVKTFDAIIVGAAGASVSATVVFEGSNTGAHWEPLGTVVLAGTATAGAAFYHDGPWAAIRATVLDVANGAVTASLGH